MPVSEINELSIENCRGSAHSLERANALFARSLGEDSELQAEFISEANAVNRKTFACGAQLVLNETTRLYELSCGDDAEACPGKAAQLLTSEAIIQLH
jgi:hypothetical protein